MSKVKGRAHTEAQKKAILNQILMAWKKMPEQRLGQLIDNATYNLYEKDIFYIEDEALAQKVVEFVLHSKVKAKVKSRFQHDCDKCLFLGQDKEHDFYFCDSRLPTVIARYGNDDSEYASGLESALVREKEGDKEYPLVKALKLARARNLIPEIIHGK